MPRRFSLVVIVVGAIAAVPLAGSIAAPTAHRAALRDFPTFVFATIADGELRGSVAAVQRSAAPRAGVFTSLHGLKPETTYRGMLTDLPCGRRVTNADSILDLMGERRTASGEDDFFENKTGRLTERLARGKTVRVFEDGRQIACAKANRVR